MGSLFMCVLGLIALQARCVTGATILHHGAGRTDRMEKVPQKHQFLKRSNVEVSKASQVEVSKASQVPIMPIEQQLMGLDPQQIAAMMAEMTLAGGAVNQANTFVRSHPNDGWSWCANAGQPCWCNGQARFGAHESGWPTFSNPIPVAGSISCDAASFASTIAWTNGLHCQCSDNSEKVWQNSKLRFNSVSYLQEAWIQMTRVLAQAKLLPFSGDRTGGGEELFGARGSGDQFRLYMDIFLKESAHFLPQTQVNCIEWGPMAYMPQFPACANPINQYVLDFEGDINKMHIDTTSQPNRHLHCDNVHLGQCLGATKFDVAINTNVWEHEIDPFEAMTSLYNVMNPGAVMLFTVPFTAPYHGVPFDFYRYTKGGVVHLLEKAGWCVPRSTMSSGGDFVGDIALFAGVGPGDFSAAENLQSYHRGYDNIPDGPIVIMGVVHKKRLPTDACPP